jgi:outer membrane immunogenic protein
MNCATRDSTAAPHRGRRDLSRRGHYVCAGLASLVLILLAPAGAAAQDGLRGSFGSPVRWDGISMGAQLGLTGMNTDFGNSNAALVAFSLRNTTVQQEFQPSNWTTLPSTSTSGRQYGVFLGYTFQSDQLVTGFDVAYNRLSTLETSASDSIARQVTTSDTFVNQVDIVAQSSLKLIDYATMRARAGYAFGQFLPYAMVGGAVGRFNYSTTATTTVSGNSPTIPPPNNVYGPTTDTQSNSKNNAITGGFLFGLGMDVAITPNVFLRGEWEYIGFAQLGGIRASLNTGRVGIGVRF